MSEHAYLSASGAHRWLACTASPGAESAFPNESSPYAREGTFAHDVANVCLERALGRITEAEFQVRHDEHITNDFWTPELQRYVDEYVDYVLDAIPDPHDAVLIEERVSLKRWIPESFGTADAIIVSPDNIRVVDLKFGKGVMVHAQDNEQMMLYALGAHAIHPRPQITMTIHQPRLQHVDTVTVSDTYLLEWGRSIKSIAQRAYYDNNVEFVPGEKQCRFCRARHTCRARADYSLQVAKQELSVLSPEEIAFLLPRLPEIIRWANDVQSYALEQAMAGVNIPEHKLVVGRSSRVYSDTQKVVDLLLDAGHTDAVINKPLGISALERLLGKKDFNALLGDHITKPKGKPTLAPLADKRESYSSSAEQDFKENS